MYQLCIKASWHALYLLKFYIISSLAICEWQSFRICEFFVKRIPKWVEMYCNRTRERGATSSRVHSRFPYAIGLRVTLNKTRQKGVFTQPFWRATQNSETIVGRQARVSVPLFLEITQYFSMQYSNGLWTSTGSQPVAQPRKWQRGGSWSRIEDRLEKRIITTIKHTRINNNKNNKCIEQVFDFHLHLPTKWWR